MVQILPEVKSFGQEFAGSIGRGIGEGVSSGMEARKKMAELSRENKEIFDATGIKMPNGLVDPKLRQNYFKTKLDEQVSLEKEGREETFLKRMFGGNKKQSFDEEINKTPKAGAFSEQEKEKEKHEEQEEFDFTKLSPEDIVEATIKNPKVGGALQKAHALATSEKRSKEEFKQTTFQKDRDYHTQFTKPIIENANKVIEAEPLRKGLMNQWERDISSNNTSGFLQWMADKSGLNFWLSPESSRSKTAAKEYFVEGLGSLAKGVRPNQFIEQQLASAQPQIGQNVEAGLTMLEMQKFLDDLKAKKAHLELDLAKEDTEKYGFAKMDIGSRASEQMKDYAQERQDQLAFNIRKIHEDQKSDKELVNEIVLDKVPQGTPLTPRMASILMIKNNDNVNAAMNEALQLGFEVPRKKNGKE